MKTLIALFLLAASPAQGDSLSVLFWNLENFFDWRDSGAGSSDAEFSSTGERRWTKKRFQTKCAAIAKAVFLAADELGGLPDIIGVAEVENRFVLKCLLEDTPLRRAGYNIVHYDSPDPRGIDVALLYRSARLDTLRTFPAGVPGVLTRDMLVAQLRTPRGDSLALIVCHHPSKYGGAAAEPKREAAVSRLQELSDSLIAVSWTRVAAIGDFNDTPDSPIYAGLEGILVNLSSEPARKGEGSIRFMGDWELIDQCFVSESLSCSALFEVFRPAFLTTHDNAYAGEKPLRTYLGPRYLGGVSDHYPILVRLHF